MEEKTTQYLNAIYQNTKVAMQSIEDIITKAKDEELVSELAREADYYSTLAQECEDFAKKHKIEKIKDNNWFEKARLWTSINIGTLFNKSSRNISEMMLFGTFMGIITCIKDKSDHKNVSKKLDEIIDKLYNFERENIDKLLPFLTKK